MSDSGSLVADRYLGFPRGTPHVLLPADQRAARAGLALYDATLPRQRLAAGAGEALLRLGLARHLRLKGLPAVLDPGWWDGWQATIGRERLGPLRFAAFRVWEDRLAALLLDEEARPRGFVKVWPYPPGPWRPRPYLQARVLDALAADPPTTFRTPHLQEEGAFDGRWYQLFQPLPAGRHRRMPAQSGRIARVLDELRERLAGFKREAHVPPHHVVGHGDLTPRNVRVAGDGNVWVFDWEYASWAPPLADELRYWTTEFALRARPRTRYAGRRISVVLLARGSKADLAEALRWGDDTTPMEARIRTAIREAAEIQGP